MARKRIDLKLLKELWAEPDNWGKSLKAMCEELRWNYKSVRKKINKYGTDKFYEERNQLLKKNLQKVTDGVYKALIQKAVEGNPKAIEMFLKMSGELTEKVELSGEVNMALIIKRQTIKKDK